MDSAVVASGTKIPIGDALITAILGYAVVFLGIVMLMAVIVIVGKIMVNKSKKAVKTEESAPAAAAPTAKVGQPAPGSAGGVKLYDTPERDAAMVMAIVADKLGKPLNEIRFISIREVK